MSLAHPYSEYLVQDSRFEILEDYGCAASYLSSWVFIVIIIVPPVLLEIIAGIYGCLSIRAFYNRSIRTHINEYNFDSNRYRNLIIFSTCDILFGIPITSLYLYLAIANLYPFPGLKEEHYDFSFISQVPAVVWRGTTISELPFEINRWITVWCAFLFFAIFGFTEESRNNYRAIFQSVVQVFVKKTGIKTRSQANSSKAAEGCVIYRCFFSCPPSDMIFRIVFHNSYTNNSTLLSSSDNHRHNKVIV